MNSVENVLKMAIYNRIVKIDYSHYINSIATIVGRVTHDYISALGRFEKKKLYQESALTDAKKTLGEVGSAAQKYINTVDNLLHYSQVADFTKIKKEIEKNNYKQLEELFHASVIDNWFEQTRLAHSAFIQEYGKASKQFTECAQSCGRQQAKAMTKKYVATIVKTTASAVSIVIGAGLVIVVVGSGIGAIVKITVGGIVMYAGGVSWIAQQFVYRFEEVEDSFKSLNSEYQLLTQHNDDIKILCDECHIMIDDYEKNYNFLKNTDQTIKQTQIISVTALDKMQQLLESTHSRITNAKQVLAKYFANIIKN